MIKKSIKFIDLDGNEKTEEAMFHLSKAELLALEAHTEGGLKEYITRLTKENNVSKIFDLFTEIITMSYGKRSDDGLVFDKTPEATHRFVHSEAYSELLVELLDPEKASEFINGILPKDVNTANK